MTACEVCSSTEQVALFDKAAHHFVRCRGCGLERISPQPTDDTLAQIYGAHYYDAWGLHEAEDVVATLKRRTFRAVLGKLPAPAPGATLLDLGAATGFLMDEARARGYEAFGVELSEFGAGEIAARFGADHVFCGELPRAAFAGLAPGQVSAITMCDYLEHVRDPRDTLRLARRWLAPGGALAITTPDAGSPSRRCSPRSSRRSPPPPPRRSPPPRTRSCAGG